MFKIKQVRKVLKGWIVKNKFIAVNLLISSIFLVIMISHSSQKTFWYDEMETLAKTTREFSYTLNEAVSLRGALSLPFFALAWLWYKIAPYGEKYLLLLTEIPIFISVFVLGFCGKRLTGGGDKICAILACLFGATSARYIFACGLEFRFYSFIVLSSTFALLFYIGCQKSLLKGMAVKKSDWIGYGISMAAIVYFHYLAILIPAGFFIADLFLFIRKKIKLNFLRPYILAALIFSPMLTLLLIFKQRNIGSFWPPIPKTIDLFYLIKNLLDGSELKLLFFAFGIAAILVYVFTKIIKKSSINWRYSVLTTMLWTVLFMITVMFIYSARISPKGSFWVLRYFYVLLPEIFLISAFGISLLINHLAYKNKAAKMVAITFLALVLFFNVLFFAADSKKSLNTERYYAVAEKLLEQQDIYAKDTAVAGQHGRERTEIFHAWNEYYVSKQGQRQKVHHATEKKIREGAYKKVYFFNGIHHTVKEDKKLFSKYNLISKDNKLQILTYERKK